MIDLFLNKPLLSASHNIAPYGMSTSLEQHSWIKIEVVAGVVCRNHVEKVHYCTQLLCSGWKLFTMVDTVDNHTRREGSAGRSLLEVGRHWIMHH